MTERKTASFSIAVSVCMDCQRVTGIVLVTPDDPVAQKLTHGLCIPCYALRLENESVTFDGKIKDTRKAVRQ